MKKIVILGAAWIILSFLFLLVVSSYSMGPLTLDAHTAVWDASPTPGVDGYYIYYRLVGTPGWSDAKRSAKLPVSTPLSYDLLTSLITMNGSYEICATATKGGSESAPSNIVPFVLDIPVSPSNLRKQ